MFKRPLSLFCSSSRHSICALSSTHSSHTSRLIRMMSKQTVAEAAQAMHFILDFDGTLTQKDTLEQLVQVAKDSTGDHERIDEAWARIKDAYLRDRATVLKTLNVNDSTSVEDERTILRELEAVEIRSIGRVSESGIFCGLTGQHVLNGAAKQNNNTNGVRIRKGVNHFLEEVNRKSQRQQQNQEGEVDRLSILSVNWSQTWIYGVLKSQLDNYERYNISKMDILSNELGGLQEPETPSNGVITGGIFSSRNKLEHLTNLRLSGTKSDQSSLVVYIGDSWTDLECLLNAELGICIGNPNTDASELANSFKRIGVKCPHVSEIDECDDWNVVWARDFTEIACWLYSNS